MTSNKFDPSELSKDHPISMALRLVSRYWFLAYSKLMSLEWEWTEAYPFGATDGKKLLINKRAMLKLRHQKNGVNLIAFFLVHEALHALLGHGWRLAPLADRKTANVSADYVVNAMIAMRNREIGKDVFAFIDGVLLDEELSGDMSVIELYRKLIKPQSKSEPQPQTDKQDDTNNDSKADPQQGDGSPDDESDTSEGDSESDSDPSDGDSGDDGSSGDGESTDPSDCGSDGAGDAGGGDDEGDGDLDLSQFVGTGADDNFAPQADGESSEQDVISQIEQDNERILVADTLDRMTSGIGGATGRRAAQERQSKVQLNWADMLRNWLNKRVRSGWDSPMNVPIYQSVNLIAAGRRSRKAGSVVMAIDTSGSIGAETYTMFLQQAQSVLDDLRPEQLVLLSVSHEVADSVVLAYGDTVPTTLKGGGGTAFKPAFDWVEYHGIDPDVMVYLTDGYSCDLSSLQVPPFDVLWLSTGLRANHFPIGDVVEIINR